MSTQPLYFEDLSAGQSYASPPMTMELERLKRFAAEFDPQPQHLDEAAAKDSLFGTLVASGWHTASLTMRLQTEALFCRFPGGALGAQVDTLAWRRPVKPGDTLRAEVSIVALRHSQSKPDRGVVRFHTTTRNQHDEIVLEMTASVLVPRRPVT